jgi:hypothetical protein
MRSDVGMELKRQMLITLAKKDTDLYPQDKIKQEMIYNRYKEFAIPVVALLKKLNFKIVLMLKFIFNS